MQRVGFIPFEPRLPRGDEFAHIDRVGLAALPIPNPACTTRHQGRPVFDCAMAVDAHDRRIVARLTVEKSVSVDLDLDVAVDALHPLLNVDVVEVNGIFEIAEGDLVVIQVEKVAFAIVLEDGAEHPAVAVIVRKLRVLEERVEFRGLFEEIAIAPEAPRGGRFRVAARRQHQFVIRGIVLLLGIKVRAIRFLIPPGITQVRDSRRDCPGACGNSCIGTRGSSA